VSMVSVSLVVTTLPLQKSETALQIPVGTTAERTGTFTEAQGQIRYNTTDDTFEGFDGTDWGPLGGLAPGDIGTGPNQVPTNQQLGQMAFVDNVATLRPFSNVNAQPVFNGEMVIAWDDANNRLEFRMRKPDGTVVGATMNFS